MSIALSIAGLGCAPTPSKNLRSDDRSAGGVCRRLAGAGGPVEQMLSRRVNTNRTRRHPCSLRRSRQVTGCGCRSDQVGFESSVGGRTPKKDVIHAVGLDVGGAASVRAFDAIALRGSDAQHVLGVGRPADGEGAGSEMPEEKTGRNPWSPLEGSPSASRTSASYSAEMLLYCAPEPPPRVIADAGSVSPGVGNQLCNETAGAK